MPPSSGPSGLTHPVLIHTSPGQSANNLPTSRFEEGRYHAQSETVLFRRGTTLVTVYHAEDVTATLRAQIDAYREEAP